MRFSKILILGSAVFTFILFMSCQEESGSTDQDAGELQYLNTVYGGCNNLNQLNIEEFVPDFKNDTVFYSVSDDTLKITVGQNYICCAPFELLQQQDNRNLLITMKDTCNWPYNSCYCRCPCYYEFEVYYTGYDHKTYYLKVYLHDPRQAADSLMHDIVIE